MATRRIRRFGSPTFWIGAVLLCLTLQQLTTVAHACAMPTDTAMPMPMRPSTRGSGVDRLACLVHCARQTPAPGDAHPTIVPPHILVALPPSMAMIVAPAAGAAARIGAMPRRRSPRPPPPSPIRIFCTLLI